jgi:pyruvate formate lyase activating enzyme
MSEPVAPFYHHHSPGDPELPGKAPDRPTTRRDFLKACGAGICLLSVAQLGLPRPARAKIGSKGLIKTKLSPWFTSLSGGDIECGLCPRRCRVSPGKRGFCRVRENREGEYHSLVYGNPCAVHVDPIEKKPLFHVLPSTKSLSIATAGCNLACKFCQNWEISQASPEDVYAYDFPPDRIVWMARETESRSIACTYVEPVIFWEYMTDIFRLSKEAGILNVCHSNAFVNPEPLEELCGLLDAANCDLKGFTEEYYREMCSGELEPVLETLKTLKRKGVHLELTNLVIPTRNDDPETIKDMCLWIKDNLGRDTPVHFSRFYPLYKLKSLPPTPVSTLEKAQAAAKSAGLRYVYIGNVPGHEAENTFCAGCGKMVIPRTGYMVGKMSLRGGKCAHCGCPLPGIWS